MKNHFIKAKLLKLWDWHSIDSRWRKARKRNKVTILNSKQTIKYIEKNNCSIARYGDGEFGLMFYNQNEDYQSNSGELSDALIDVLGNRSEKLLICIPYPMISISGLKKHGKAFWKTWSHNKLDQLIPRITEKTGRDYVFGDSFVSRPYTAYKSRRFSKSIFLQLKGLWEGKDILIVEGDQTRLGVGNDLFCGASSIKRILAPGQNAFDRYATILQTVLDIWNGEIVIAALGPAATVLASDLSRHDIQTLDLGHVDIQYEWFLRGNDFQQIEGKYTNETPDKTEVGACQDAWYLSQIVSDLSRL